MKNFKFNSIIKAIIILLTLVFAFLAGTNALDLARKTIYYGNESEKIQNTPVFLENVERILLPISWDSVSLDYYGQNVTFEEYCKNSEDAKATKEHYNEQLKDALYYFNEIQALKANEPKQDGTSYVPQNDLFYDKNGNEYGDLASFLYEMQSKNSQENVTTVVSVYPTDEGAPENKNTAPVVQFGTHAEWEYEYQNLRDELFSIVNDARSEATIKKELEEKCNHELEEKYRFIMEDFSYLTEKYENVDFYVENPETGYYVSNLNNAKEIEALKNNYKNNAIFYFHSDGRRAEFTPMKIDLEGNFVYNNLRFLQADTELTEIVTNFDNCIVYVKINAPVGIEDNFFVVTEIFEEISNSEKYNTEALKSKTCIFSVLTLIGIIAAAIFSSPKYKNQEQKLTLLQRTPFIFSLIFCCSIIFAIFMGIIGVVYADFLPERLMSYEEMVLLDYFEFFSQMVGILVAALALFISIFINYIVVNKKAGALKERFFSYKIFKALKSLHEKNKGLGNSIKRIETKLLILVCCWFVVEALVFCLMASLFINGLEMGGIFFLLIFIGLIVLAVIFVLKFLGQTNTLSFAAEEIKNGNFDINLDPASFVFPLKDFAKNLNECRNSVEIAVKEAIKGEKLKTELITNVSHDLKTPLTSIINYVSLLKLCDIQGENENKYLEILDEKSKKLQRLIEDLTEASKASSGNIKMNIATVNLNELALQAVGENNDILESVGLEIIISEKDNEVFVRVDSQHTFRIFDNLFSNVKKYALSGTRVYIDVYKENSFGVFSVKNISKDKLNINLDEITERFVRGDNSRTTEGSGLGLSIARSFTELQNGIFDVQIDGDLFKVVIKLPLTDRPMVTPEATVSSANEFGAAKENKIN